MDRGDAELGIRAALTAYRIREARTWNIERNEQERLAEDMGVAMRSVIRSWKKKEKEEEEEGVYSIAPSFASLQVLVQCLASPEVDIPVSALGLGPVSPADIRKASKQLKPQVIMAFKVEVTPEASQLAEAFRVKIISGDSVEDMCQQFKDELGEKEEARSDSDEEVSPCVLSILPKFVLNKEDPIVVGVSVVEGLVQVGTPLCVPRTHRGFIYIGRVAWIEKDQRPVEVAREGDTVIIKIVDADPKTQQAMLGREFDVADVLLSRIPRRHVYYHFIIPS
ncbi:unnamed protein product [Microthlaspi erraticum]|uniref:Uncharacterized protein n=1 Tax=Microthlaspi erraticum TaxID=1685480 RepID=A0A6D2JSW2_9BRAS|nr:unnamed protein product [Microthlaspi erraticum]CAA7040308.1 unnamed protein product [Microthlaspi erraticum]